MHVMRGICAVAAMAMALAGQAGAQAVDGATARKMAFKPKGVQVTIVAHDFLSETDRTALAYAAEQQAYYGAIAVSPSEGLISEATLAAANFHDVDSARAKALESCNAARKTGTRPCVIAAEIRPSRWEARPLSLSASATEALRQEYGRGRGERALAISPSTGKYAVSKGAGAADAALATCAAAAGAGDCRLAVADR